MTKDEALKISAKFLAKVMATDSDQNMMECLAVIHTAEADKDYAKMYRILEDTKKFINKLQAALKQK